MNNGKPFQSKLEPHFDFILAARRKNQTWQAIAQQLATHGITTTKQAVHIFLKRRLKRRYPLGAAPAEPTPKTINHQSVQRRSPDRPEFSEKLPDESDFVSDPLTTPPMGKTKSKSKWAVLIPNP